MYSSELTLSGRKENQKITLRNSVWLILLINHVISQDSGKRNCSLLQRGHFAALSFEVIHLKIELKAD